MAVNKVVYGTTVLVDLTGDTVTAGSLAQGYTAHDKSGALITGTAPMGISGDAYTRTEVVPSQTVTPNSSRAASFTALASFVDGEYYVVTYDGTEYVVTAETLWTDNVILGDAQVVWQTSDVLYPFALISAGTEREGYFTTTSAHTIKVELLEFTGDATILSSKSITANGTYTASADNADGYSSVTVNVPSGGASMNVQVAQSTTRVASTTYTKTATLTCSKAGTYDVYWDCFRSSTSGTSGSQLHIGGSEYGNPNTTFSSNIHVQSNHLTGVTLAANQEVAVYVRSRATNYYAYCGQLTIVQTA